MKSREKSIIKQLFKFLTVHKPPLVKEDADWHKTLVKEGHKVRRARDKHPLLLPRQKALLHSLTSLDLSLSLGSMWLPSESSSTRIQGENIHSSTLKICK